MTAAAPALSAFEVVRGMARCPAHEDNVRSLSVKEGKDGRALLRCFAGCTFEQIIAAAGLTPADAFAPQLDVLPSSAPRRVPQAEYTYHDASGAPAFLVRRWGKDAQPPFTAHKADGARLGDTERLPYRLPEIIAARRGVIVVEGEKDADRLAAAGLTATTNPFGAGQWLARFAPYFAGREVAILPDNDEPGRKHAVDVASKLRDVASSVRIVTLPGLTEKGADVSDWLDRGHSIDELRQLIAATPAIDSYALSARGPVRLADIEPRKVEWLWPGYVPRGKVTILDGDPGLGKSTIALDLAARISTGGATPTGDAMPAANVLYVTSEDDPADTIRPRLDVAGGDPSRVHVLARLTLPDDAAELEGMVKRLGVALVIVDPLVGYLAEGVRANSDHSVRRALEPLASMAERQGCSIIGIRHLNKRGGDGSDAIYRGGGSIGFAGLARAVMAVGRDPQDPDRFVLASVKLNVAKRPPSLAYRLVAAGPYDPAFVAWEGESEHTAETLIGRDRERAAEMTETGKLTEAIREIVTNNGGSILARDGFRALEEAGFDTSEARKSLIARARARAGVATGKQGISDGWMWYLREDAAPS